MRALLARHDEIELLLRMGEYARGSDPLADEAIAKLESIRGFLYRSLDMPLDWASMRDTLSDLAA